MVVESQAVSESFREALRLSGRNERRECYEEQQSDQHPPGS